MNIGKASKFFEIIVKFKVNSTKAQGIIIAHYMSLQCSKSMEIHSVSLLKFMTKFFGISDTEGFYQKIINLGVNKLRLLTVLFNDHGPSRFFKEIC